MTYRAAVAAKAAGLHPRRLQNLLDRGIVEFQQCDQPTKGSGNPRGHSKRRILQFAIIGQLTPLGILPKRAAAAAFEFSDRGNDQRAAGELFPLGRTILIGTADGAHVINVAPDETLDEKLPALPTFIVDVGPIHSQVENSIDS